MKINVYGKGWFNMSFETCHLHGLVICKECEVDYAQLKCERLEAENLALSLALTGAREALEKSIEAEIYNEASGDCGHWDVEEQKHIKACRAALSQMPPSLSRAQKLLEVVEKAKKVRNWGFKFSDISKEGEELDASLDALASLEGEKLD